MIGMGKKATADGQPVGKQKPTLPAPGVCPCLTLRRFLSGTVIKSMPSGVRQIWIQAPATSLTVRWLLVNLYCYSEP
jgi:hypothetical protein